MENLNDFTARTGKGPVQQQTRKQKEEQIADLKQKNAATLDNIIGTLQGTNQSADSTLAKLDKNTGIVIGITVKINFIVYMLGFVGFVGLTYMTNGIVKEL